ncbi:MAG: hypothetical protein GF331_14855 [Chitinivibrionales bacterium]|nr:hypothetical protein [Chitinivibrionales bacterium]
MKTSTKVLLIAALSVWALLAAALVTVSRVAAADNAPLSHHDLHGADSSVIVAPSLDQFTDVHFEGLWGAQVFYSDRCTVSVTVPAAYQNLVTVTRDGRRLVCRSPAGLTGDSRAQATIGMPDIRALHAHGQCKITLRDMVLDSLQVRSEGMTSINSRDLRVTSLDYRGRGMGRLVLNDEGVTNAHVNAEGMGSVELHMLGGSLSGRLEGMVQLRYTGDVTSNTVSIEGIALTTRD